jgi:hypothetical protein
MFGNIYRMAGTRILPRQRIVDCTKKMKSITRKAKQLIERRTKMTKRVIQSVKKWQTKYKTASDDIEKKKKQLINDFYKQYEYCQNIKQNPNDEDLTKMGSILMDCTKKMKSFNKKATQLKERRTKMTNRFKQSVKNWQTKYKTASEDMEKKNKQLINDFYKQYEYCQNIKKRNPNDEDLTNMVSILTDEKFYFDTSNLSKEEENFINDLVKL